MVLAVGDLPYAKKALGQHWLTDLTALQAMVTAAEVGEGQAVLEVGPGTGTLTDQLLAVKAAVTALEFDQERIVALQKQYDGREDITIEAGDIRTFDLSILPKDYKLVANIPYYLTSHLLRRLVDEANKPEVAALLVQKEVAERVAAKAGDMSQLSVFVQLCYEVSLDELVPAYLFTPPPKVDSQILVLKRRSSPLFPLSDNFRRVVKAGYGERRKKLRSALSTGLGFTKPEVEQLLEKAEIRPDARAQELTLEEWHRLACAV